jgi:ADP-ribose pyrophosphatase YjhB (NUDIX family)
MPMGAIGSSATRMAAGSSITATRFRWWPRSSNTKAASSSCRTKGGRPRASGSPPTWFGLVTGFLEAGETPQQGVLRELKEELGLDGEIVSMIGVYSFDMRNELIIAFHVRASGTLVQGEELSGHKREAPEKLRPWPMGTGEAVKDWLAARNQAPT